MQVTSLQEKAYRTIRKAIASGQFKPGERLVETRLAGELSITRGPVREALFRLEHDEMVVRIPGVGVFVADFDESSLDELVEVRTALEAIAARRAAQRCDGVGAAQLMRQLEELRDKAKPDERGNRPPRSDIMHADMGLHLLISEIGACPFVKHLLADQHVIERMMTSGLPFFPEAMTEAEAEAIIEEHVRIVEAIVGKHADEAAEVAREVLAKAAEEHHARVRGRRLAVGTQ